MPRQYDFREVLIDESHGALPGLDALNLMSCCCRNDRSERKQMWEEWEEG